MTGSLKAEQIGRSAPLSFAVVWAGIVIGHASFMLGAIEEAGWAVRGGLLAFHALFVVAGVDMLRSALGWRRFVKAFGTPLLDQVPGGEPGEALDLSLRFDRAWPSEKQLVASVWWVTYDEDGHIDRTFEGCALDLAIQRIGNQTLAHATGILPIPSTTTLAACPTPQLHLHCHEQAQLGWRLRLSTGFA